MAFVGDNVDSCDKMQTKALDRSDPISNSDETETENTCEAMEISSDTAQYQNDSPVKLSRDETTPKTSIREEDSTEHIDDQQEWTKVWTENFLKKQLQFTTDPKTKTTCWVFDIFH